MEEQLNIFTSKDTKDCIYVFLNPLQSHDYIDQIRILSSRNKLRHICYFNGSNSLKYFRSLCKSIKTVEHQPLWTSHKSSHLNTYLSNSRQFCVPSFLPFSSYAGHSLNLMPLILYDLSLASPRKLYISGLILLHRRKYTERDIILTSRLSPESQIFISHSRRGHDPITNIRYFKYLINLFPKVEMTSDLQKLCQISEYEYLELINSVF